MSVPEQIAQRLHNAQIEIREPLRRELDILTAEYLARGGNVVQLPHKFDIPKPLLPRSKPKISSKADDMTWSDEEIDAVRYMKAIGLNNVKVAAALNAHYVHKRTPAAVKSICQREEILLARQPRPSPMGSGRPANRGDGWEGWEDALLCDLNAKGLTVIEIAKHFAGRTVNGVRARLMRIGLEFNPCGVKV